ncbi:(3S)-malyl-CoA thioesterase [Pseudovibrio axinellae]|uniref:(3S)-malyl-CoA thioesterase n=1 Tax=Pseudovibrio axinellae TaxID=989403 RepID=A0A165ZQA9_9HYPH|nr:CoA ester lyase [Pseudovibrio axinellae]KZL20145.1 (3S)-malyl-CoA thioesterase [Pseudovibrio axinellae]SEQ23374.1 citrate lyase subunit beta / citryl-CoA lyase [Pseudovibrio axinellae]
MSSSEQVFTIRPRRSALYMPGSNARALEKAKGLDVDVLLLDLEDAVAPDAKEMAREQVCEAVANGGYGHRELVIRINGLKTPWGNDDLKAAVAAKPNAVLLPKVESLADIKSVANYMAQQGTPDDVRIWAMLETPGAILNASEIAEAAQDPDNRLDVFIVGTNDLSKESGAQILPGRAVLMPWLMTFLALARVGGADILDGVYNNFSDLEGFTAECDQGAEMGMNGKTLIHPKQLQPCNTAFSPSEAEVEWAKKMIAAFELPENAGKGAVQVEGKMVERLHAEIGKKTVAVAEAITRDANA